MTNSSRTSLAARAYGLAVVSVCALSFAAACGGGASASGESAKTPESAAATADAGVAPATSAASGPSTTTTDLPDAEAAPTHLPQAGTSSGDAGAPAAHFDGHAHEMGRTPADIRASVVAHRDQARACYDGALADHPGLEGDLVIKWTIDPKGNVTETSLDSAKSQITEPGVVACISAIIKRIQFAASPGGYETKAFYPFNFHPHHATRPTPAP
jgi:hypothetical protein